MGRFSLGRLVAAPRDSAAVGSIPKPLKLPRYVFHLAEATNWPSIQRHGLLSAIALLGLAGIRGEEAMNFARRHRPDHTELANGVHIRDQKPMPPQALAHCLVRMSPADWYQLVNSKVFFWLDARRLNRQRVACEPRPQVVLVVETARLLAQYADTVSLTPINTGNARRKPATRGESTFVPYAVWSTSGWASESIGLGVRPRARLNRPVELTVTGAVPGIVDMLVRVCPLKPGESFNPNEAVER